MGDSNDPTPQRNRTVHGEATLPDSLLAENDVFEALAHPRRRYILSTLLEDETRTLGTSARNLAAREAGIPPTAVADEDVERVYASLYHAHVPKLVDLDVIEFDRRAETITRGPNAEQVLTVLELTGRSGAVDLGTRARSQGE